jgi:hypothetical protein
LPAGAGWGPLSRMSACLWPPGIELQSPAPSTPRIFLVHRSAQGYAESCPGSEAQSHQG